MSEQVEEQIEQCAPVEVSIIIPTHNRAHSLEQVLVKLRQQTFPAERFEVVVVADGCTDNTAAVVRANTGYRCLLIEQAQQGPAAARNTGIRQARGALIVFLDDDVRPISEFLEEHVTAHSRHEQTVVIGPQLPPTDARLAPWVAWEAKVLVRQYDAMQRGLWQATYRQFYTGNSSVARRFLLQAGLFDTRYKRAEDVELAARLSNQGLDFHFQPTAIGWHYAYRTYKSWKAAAYQYGYYDVLMDQNQGRGDILETMASHYYERHPATCALVRLCLGHRLLSKAVIALLGSIAYLVAWLSAKPLSTGLYGSIFNLLYYTGVADNLGGVSPFWQYVDRFAPVKRQPQHTRY